MASFCIFSCLSSLFTSLCCAISRQGRSSCVTTQVWSPQRDMQGFFAFNCLPFLPFVVQRCLGVWLYTTRQPGGHLIDRNVVGQSGVSPDEGLCWHRFRRPSVSPSLLLPPKLEQMCKKIMPFFLWVSYRHTHTHKVRRWNIDGNVPPWKCWKGAFVSLIASVRKTF